MGNSDLFGSEQSCQITIGTEPTARSFVAHKGFLSFFSGYFARVFKNGFVEGQTSHVHLPTEDPEIVEAFLRWTYLRRVTFQDGLLDADHFTNTLIQLWVFADAHEIPRLQNETLNLLHQKLVEYWRVDIVHLNWIYEHTMPGAPLRRYYVKVLASTCHTESHLTDKNRMSLSREAAVDILEHVWTKGYKRLGKSDLDKWDLCEFHVHEEDVECTK